MRVNDRKRHNDAQVFGCFYLTKTRRKIKNSKGNIGWNQCLLTCVQYWQKPKPSLSHSHTKCRQLTNSNYTLDIRIFCKKSAENKAIVQSILAIENESTSISTIKRKWHCPWFLFGCSCFCFCFLFIPFATCTFAYQPKDLWLHYFLRCVTSQSIQIATRVMYACVCASDEKNISFLRTAAW